ncbi:hypothetical protein EDD76_102316 [Kineothrix alysoides]|uniref:ABC transporter permease n=1 Tax=Kineothrix alysoides TaxID=1469948 RepID=A0A4V2QCK3_9FIRM|nr:hypothetical protein [Kineothrix alysoides]TCL60617.1 hypothetical protein EDD76_102316 [Kineothrix alysoides]
MLLVEIIVLCVLFFGICYFNTGNDERNIKSYYSYPEEVQEIVKKNPVLRNKIRSAKSIVTFLSNVVVFGIVIFIFGFFIKQPSVWNNFINLLILGQCLNAFDFLIIDMIWWRNSARIRFTGTENMAELYRNPQKHFISFLKGVLVFLIVALIDGMILSLMN